jgi:hypothetical protein
MFFSRKKIAHSETGNLPKNPEFSQLYGTYRGFAPADESPNALGELEVVISASSVKLSQATGLKVNIAEFPLDQFKRLNQDKIKSTGFKLEQTMGFQLGESDITYFFTPIVENNDALGLIIKGGIADYIGPTLAFGPKHIMDGIWQKMLEKLQEQGMPLLKQAGKTSPEYYEKQEVTRSFSM